MMGVIMKLFVGGCGLWVGAGSYIWPSFLPPGKYTLGETRGPGRDFDGRCNESLKQTSYKQIPL